ncbi:MAG: MarR family winged helix-turn-helix transcriptional regulator [Acidimicrobiales bacterium]
MATTASRTHLLEHPHLTTSGLFLEAFAGLTGASEARIESASGLSAQWFEVLIRLARSPGHRLRMTELAAQTTLTPSGLTRAVDRIVDAGLVERQACPTDRRSTYAVLTTAGEKRLMQALPAHVAHLEEVFDGVFTRAELDTLTDLLHRLRDATNPCAAQASTPEGFGDDA